MKILAATLGILVMARVLLDFMSIKKTSDLMHGAYIVVFLVAGLVILLAPETNSGDTPWGWGCISISAIWLIYLCWLKFKKVQK